VYKGRAIPQLNEQADPLYTDIEKSGKYVQPWGGGKVVRAATAGARAGFGAGSETGALPSTPVGTAVNFESNLKSMYATIEMTGLLLASTKSSAEAFVQPLDYGFNQMLTYSKKNLARQAYGDGTGALCKVSASMAEAGVAFTVTDYTNLDMGMLVDIYAADGTTVVASKREIKNIVPGTEPAATVTVSGANFQAAKDAVLYVQGSKDLEITGLGTIISTTADIYGLSRTTYGFLQSVVYAMPTGATGITDSVILENLDKVEKKGGSINYLACAPDVRAAYAKYLDLSKRNVNVMKLNGGFSGIAYNSNGKEIPIVKTFYLSSGTLIGLNKDDFSVQQLGDWDYIDEGGILKQVAGYDKYTATLKKYCELLCDKPGQQLKITGIGS
jgi:hypothetical protein